MTCINEYGQPVGDAMPNWIARPYPERVTLTGRTCRLEALCVDKHCDELRLAFQLVPDGRNWTYLPDSYPSNSNDFRDYIEACEHSSDPKYYAIIDLKSDKAVGFIALSNIDPANGSIEVGRVTFSSLLQRTISSTEAQYLLMRYVFEELGYRRYEWKCENLNEPSQKAARRLGFKFETLFRKSFVYKGRTRDTVWYSIIDTEWPVIKKSFEAWLAPSNFDCHGHQIKSLDALRAEE